MTNKTRTKLKRMNFMSRERRIEVINNETKESMVSIAKAKNEKLQTTTRRSL
jgi:hypothetical protein